MKRMKLMQKAMAVILDSCTDSRLDMSEGTIVTVPYYSAPNRTVEIKAVQ